MAVAAMRTREDVEVLETKWSRAVLAGASSVVVTCYVGGLMLVLWIGREPLAGGSGCCWWRSDGVRQVGLDWLRPWP